MWPLYELYIRGLIWCRQGMTGGITTLQVVGECVGRKSLEPDFVDLVIRGLQLEGQHQRPHPVVRLRVAVQQVPVTEAKQ